MEQLGYHLFKDLRTTKQKNQVLRLGVQNELEVCALAAGWSIEWGGEVPDGLGFTWVGFATEDYTGPVALFVADIAKLETRGAAEVSHFRRSGSHRWRTSEDARGGLVTEQYRADLEGLPQVPTDGPSASLPEVKTRITEAPDTGRLVDGATTLVTLDDLVLTEFEYARFAREFLGVDPGSVRAKGGDNQPDEVMKQLLVVGALATLFPKHCHTAYAGKFRTVKSPNRKVIAETVLKHLEQDGLKPPGIKTTARIRVGDGIALLKGHPVDPSRYSGGENESKTTLRLIAAMTRSYSCYRTGSGIESEVIKKRLRNEARAEDLAMAVMGVLLEASSTVSAPDVEEVTEMISEGLELLLKN